MCYAQILLIIYYAIMPLFGQTYTWSSYTIDNSPLPSNNLNALYLGNDGILWIGTTGGVSKLISGDTTWANWYLLNETKIVTHYIPKIILETFSSKNRVLEDQSS